MTVQTVKNFVLRENKPAIPARLNAVSLFSGGGLSDLGYELAGFRFLVQVEADQRRSEIGADNFPGSTWITGDVCCSGDTIVKAYREASGAEIGPPDGNASVPGHEQFEPKQGETQYAAGASAGSKEPAYVGTDSLCGSAETASDRC